MLADSQQRSDFSAFLFFISSPFVSVSFFELFSLGELFPSSSLVDFHFLCTSRIFSLSRRLKHVFHDQSVWTWSSKFFSLRLAASTLERKLNRFAMKEIFSFAFVCAAACCCLFPTADYVWSHRTKWRREWRVDGRVCTFVNIWASPICESSILIIGKVSRAHRNKTRQKLSRDRSPDLLPMTRMSECSWRCNRVSNKLHEMRF